MKSKVVENWLTKVTELTFTIPFCQLLLSKGQRVVHISSQGPMEQGKDVIAVDRKGKVHCYQLKCGRINGRVWGEIKSEIDQLVELPPRHPSLKNVQEWNAYLVTNGGIANPTARDIADYSEAKTVAGHRALTTITGTELVAEFVEFYDSFIPVEVEDLQTFLELYNEKGESDLRVDKFKSFFEGHFLRCGGMSRQKKVEAIQAALVICDYVLAHKYEKRNYLDVVKAYTLLLACIYHFVAKHALPEKLWRQTESLAYNAIHIAMAQLVDEIISHPENYVETEHGVMSECVVYKVRCSELCGYLSAYEILCTLTSMHIHRHGEIQNVIQTMMEHRALLGECFTPFFVNRILALLFEQREGDVETDVGNLLKAHVIVHTDRGEGIPSPYYDITQSVKWAIGLDTGIEETFHRMSYTMWPTVLLASRLGFRALLNSLWPVISRVQMQDFCPPDPADILLWRAEEGVHSGRFPDATQSWPKLVEESLSAPSPEIPPVLANRTHFFPLLINVMPHRFSYRLICSIIDAYDAASQARAAGVPIGLPIKPQVRSEEAQGKASLVHDSDV